MQLVVRDDSESQASRFERKDNTVMSYQDTTYALLGLLASVGLSKDDIDIQSAGPTGVLSQSRRANRLEWRA